jgi:glycosyltransferase involved in cell wall biosynthesis
MSHWSFVLTCFEPIGTVTGGIGTYSRLLLQLLADKAPSVLLLTSERNRAQDTSFLKANVRVELIPDEAKLDGVRVNNLRNPHREFAFGAMQRLRDLAAQGHTFGYLEVPDYCAEGQFIVKAREAGLLKIDRVGVRLHSPVLMLHEDNQTRGRSGVDEHRFYEEERTVYALADDVLYGGDAMLERVARLLPAKLEAEVRRKAVKIPHPWPAPAQLQRTAKASGPFEIGYVGRLEYRKGVDLLVRAAVKALETRTLKFHFFGRDTDTFFGGSVRAHLDTLIPAERRESFVFHDYVPQEDLRRAHLPRMDLFVFPSRFENYPNVLLEVLELGTPVLASRHGCMPEIGRGFPVTDIEPEDTAELARLLADAPNAKVPRSDYAPAQQAITREVENGYAERLRAPARAAASGAEGAITFIVAHFNHARWLAPLFASLKPQLVAGDHVIVVDDCSRLDQAAAAKSITEAEGFEFLSTPKNSGPSAARNLALAAVKTPLIYIVDADDELEAETVSVLRRTLAQHPELDGVTGFMRAFADEHHVWAGYEPSLATVLVENSLHCGLLARRELFARVHGYQTAQRHHYEDWELNMRLVIAGARLRVVPLVTYRYRVDLRGGRNTSDPARARGSHEQCLRSALATLTPEQLPAVSELLVSLLMRPQEVQVVERVPDVLRYQLVDRVNLLLKKTPLHATLKNALSRVRD